MTDRIARIARSATWRASFIEANGYRCHYCNRPGGPTLGPDSRAWHVDHKNPLADGGEDTEDNLALACKRCNIAKHTQPYKQFRAYASVAFWNEAPEPVSSRSLDDLLGAWVGTQQGTWFYEVPEADRAPYRVHCRPDEEISNSADELVAVVEPGYGRRGGGHFVAEFLIHAHRMVPQLIAEIHMLRAELAEARNHQSTPAAA